MADRLAFVAEWLDPVSGVTWNYQLMFFPDSLEVEMFDMKNRRTFLRRCKIEGLKPELFFIGGKVTIYGRQLDIKYYGDSYTRKVLEETQQRTLAILKPDAIQHMGKIVHEIYNHGFVISKMRLCRLSHQEAKAFYAPSSQEPAFDAMSSLLASGNVLALELVASNAVQKWKDLLGPSDPAEARADAPASIRAKFGADAVRNACHGADSPDAAAREADFFFGPAKAGASAVGSGSTLGIIKPHVIADKCAGAVLDEMASQFAVRSLAMFHVDKPAAAEFFEVYRGVVAPSEYSGMVDELTSGPCIVAELGPKDGGEPVEPFRQLCGPADPEVARVLRPLSLRARFGIDKNRNAVHCTDLQEDGPLEVNYFFQIMQGA